jgi:hypothetical protein
MGGTTAASEICPFSYHLKKAALFPSKLQCHTDKQLLQRWDETETRGDSDTTASGKLVKQDNGSQTNYSHGVLMSTPFFSPLIILLNN